MFDALDTQWVNASSQTKLAGCLCKPWKWAEFNYKIVVINFASCYCISHGNSANTRPYLKIDTWLVGIRI